MLACPLAYHITHPLTFLIDPTRPISQFPPAFFSSQFDSPENTDLFSLSPLSHYVILLSSLSLHKKPISHTQPIPTQHKKRQKSCTLLVDFNKATLALANEIKESLEGNDVESKIEALKKAIMLLLNSETIPQLFITIIRYVLPSEDHTIQKLLLLYLELIEKTDSKGKVLPEMILICQNLRNNLQHPDEFIRGVTLRFLYRLNESKIFEPLLPSILSNLEHRHPFVRRNAVLAVMSVYKLPQGEQLLDSA